MLAADGAGLLAAAAPLVLRSQVQADPLEVLTAYLAVGWWAILMVPVGGFALSSVPRVLRRGLDPRLRNTCV